MSSLLHTREGVIETMATHAFYKRQKVQIWKIGFLPVWDGRILVRRGDTKVRRSDEETHRKNGGYVEK